MSSDNVCLIRVFDAGSRDVGWEHKTVSMSDIWAKRVPGRIFPSLIEAIIWHNGHCNSEYGLQVKTHEMRERIMDQLTPQVDDTIVNTYVRRPFEVQAIQVTAQNMAAVARWCGGKIAKTRTEVNFIDVPTVKEKHPSHGRAFVGSWVVTGREGTFSTYSDKTFQRTFEQVLYEN